MLQDKHLLLIIIIISLIINGCSTRFDPFISNAKREKSQNKFTKKGTMRAYQVNGIWYYPKKERLDSRIRGIASWYGEKFHGRKTANGEIYNMYSMTAAHKTLPMNTMLLIKNLETDKKVIVRVNDRGPFIGDRVLDMSKSAAEKLGMLQNGTALVEIRILGYDGKIEINQENKIKDKDKINNQENLKSQKVVIKPIIKKKILPKQSIENNISNSNSISNSISNSTTMVIQPIELAIIEENQELNFDSNVNLVIQKNPVDIEDIATPIRETVSHTSSSNIKFDGTKTHQIIATTADDNIPTFILKENNLPNTHLVINKEPKISKKYFYVQVASFRDIAGAKVYIDKYAKVLEKHLKFVVQVNRGLHKIWIKGFQTKEEAKTFIKTSEIFPKAFFIIKEEDID